jgi:Flp pilus assembly protein TadD
MRYLTLSIKLTIQLLLATLTLSACSTTAVHINTNEQASLWQDQTYAYNKNADIIPQSELFRLDDELKSSLNTPEVRALVGQDKVNFFLRYFYRLGSNVFPYQSNLSTIPSVTWKNKQGDCISLTLLSYAIGKELKLDINMQEVKVPIQIDRRGNVDYLSGHVNAIILDAPYVNNDSEMVQKYLTIDFSDLPTTSRLGNRLKENQIAARFYNNMGVKNYLDKNPNLAYHYFKTAIELDADYQATYINLAQLYSSSNLYTAAELVLTTALKLNYDNFIALNSLKELYTSSGRIELSEQMKELIIKSNQKNPYYWVGLGLNEMKNKNYKLAISHLEKANQLTQGFIEIHQNLADAYFQLGDIANGKMQLKEIRALEPNHPKLRFDKNF